MTNILDEPWWSGLENVNGYEHLKEQHSWKPGDLFYDHTHPSFLMCSPENWIEETYLPSLFANTMTLAKYIRELNPMEAMVRLRQCDKGGPLYDIVPPSERLEVYDRFRLNLPKNRVVPGFLEVYETTRELVKHTTDECVSYMMASSIIHFAIQHEVRALNGLRLPLLPILEMLSLHLDDERYLARFCLIKGFMLEKIDPERSISIWDQSEMLRTDATMLLIHSHTNIDLDPDKAYEQLLDSVEVCPSLHTFLAYKKLAELWWGLKLNPKEIYQADEVMLKDLTSAKGKLLNGKTGIVIQKLNNGRIEVELDDGKRRISFAKKNLQKKYLNMWNYVVKYCELFCSQAPRDQLCLPSVYYMLIESRVKEFYGGGAKPVVNGRMMMTVSVERDPLEPKELRHMIETAFECEKQLCEVCPDLMEEYDYQENCEYYVRHLYAHMDDIEKNWTPIEECFQPGERFYSICPCQCFDNTKCKVCKKPCKAMVCAKCKCAYYCSRKCQDKDWKKHKRWCKKNRKISKNFVPFWNFSTFLERMGKKGAKDWKKWNLKHRGKKDLKYESNI